MKLVRIHSTLMTACLLLALSSCRIAKFVPEGELVRVAGEVVLQNDSVVEDKSALKSELKDVLRPRPARKVLGAYPGLYFYYKNQKEKPNFIHKFLYKKFGQKPTYTSQTENGEVEKLIRNRLENRGYFYTSVTSNFEYNEKKKTSVVTYSIAMEQPYTMASYQQDTLPSPLDRAIRSNAEKTLIKPDQRFDLNTFKAERERLEIGLKKDGYYNFNNGFLLFEADTNRYDNRKFDLFLTLKKDVPKKAIIPYTVTEVNVYPASGTPIEGSADTVVVNGIHFIGGEGFFKPVLLAPFITLKAGERYSAAQSKATSRRLSTIGVYKFVNIQYEEADTSFSSGMGKLKANVFLSPLNKRAIKAELQAVSKSNNFAGPALAVSYSNRNLFNGGETLKLSSTAGYEFQVGGDTDLGFNTILGLKGELIFPRVIAPVKFNADFFKHDIPKTKMSLAVDYSNRSRLYRLISGTAEFGYDWNAAKYVEHLIVPISINYTNLYRSTPEFEAILEENPFLQRSFDQQFIAGLNYSFTYNELVNTRKRHGFYFNTTFDLAGNLFSALIPQPTNSEESKQVLGLDYAQFAKLDLDARYHLRFKNEKSFVLRLFSGYGLPYGNSDVMPFSRQYFAGGPYSVRAFAIRSLGPGRYDNESSDNAGFFEQTGNIRLEANVEYRFPIISYLKGAIFTDAGNVWNSEQNENQVGGEFTSSFLQELGVGSGIGLRIDVQGFVIRFDFATPIHTPSEPDKWNFDVADTRFNFAIGYPF